MQSPLLCCWKRVLAVTSAFSWQNSVSLCPALFCTPRPNCLLILQVSLDFLLLHSSPLWWIGHLFLVLVLRGLLGLHWFFSASDLDYCDTEWFPLGTNWDHFVILEVAPKYCISDSLVDSEGYSSSSMGFLPTEEIQWSAELTLPVPLHSSSLIPKTSMFTLAISCLTMSGLPWCMDLTFQDLLQYCSLQHRILLSSPDIHPERRFCFGLSGAVSSCSPLFPGSMLDPFRPGGLICWCRIFSPFYRVFVRIWYLGLCVFSQFLCPFSRDGHIRCFHIMGCCRLWAWGMNAMNARGFSK